MRRLTLALAVVLTRKEPTVATWHIHPTVLKIKTLAIEHEGIVRASLVPAATVAKRRRSPVRASAVSSAKRCRSIFIGV